MKDAAGLMKIHLERILNYFSPTAISMQGANDQFQDSTHRKDGFSL